MSTSKLAFYIEVIKSLLEHGSQSLYQISKHFDNNKTIEQCLKFLVENSLVTQQRVGGQPVYSIASRGIDVLAFFRIKPSEATIKMER